VSIVLNDVQSVAIVSVPLVEGLCGLVVRLPGSNPEVPGSITDAARFSE
jgi:hypothetical protein